MSLARLTIALSIAATLASTARAGQTVGVDVSTPSHVDIARATPMPMPAVSLTLTQRRLTSDALASSASGPAGFSPGGSGDGVRQDVPLPHPKPAPQPDVVAPQEYGTGDEIPYTTSKQSYATLPYYSAAGKLFFKDKTKSFECSGSLIKPGVVVTAAHCVAERGKKQYHTDFKFIPAYNPDYAPYGEWEVSAVRLMTSYFSGDDNCTQGYICENDLAVLVLKAQDGVYPGARAGWFAFGWNGYGVNSQRQSLITQLGYPYNLEEGQQMMRTDSQGFAGSDKLRKNTVIGSLQGGGTSGGPWIANFGEAPKVTAPKERDVGKDPKHNIVVGVTSWGTTDDRNESGASAFTDKNIKTLVDEVCKATPAACKS